jgi:uncharacterized integral membrane protein
MLQKIRYFLFLTAVLVVIVVAFQNHHPVDIEILTFRGQYPLTLLMLSTAVVSFILGSIMTAWRSRKRGRARETQSRDDAAKEIATKEAKANPGTAKSADSAASDSASNPLLGE